MTIRTFPRQYSARQIATGSDEVLFAFPLAQGAHVNNAWLDFSMQIPDVNVLSAIVTSLFGYIVPIVDIDSAQTPDAIWDQQIPKDSVDDTADSLDIDLHSAVDDPLVELGDVNINSMLDLMDAPTRTFKRETLLTFPKSPVGFKTGTPDTYYAQDSFRTKLKSNYTVKVPSYYLVGLGVATGADTSTIFPIFNGAGQWAQLAYMKDALVDAMKAMVGLHVSGTQEASTEAMILIHQYLEHVIEDVAAQWGTGTVTTWAKMTMDITVPGDFDVAQLSAQA